jgi:hypothetical protein
MPLQKLQLRPGLNREGTDYANEGGWYDGDKIRFRSGFPEKLGGWVRLSASTFLGVARSLWNWATLNGSNLLGVGTNLKYYIEDGGVYNDITPIVANASEVNAISTGFTTLAANINATTNTFTVASSTNFPPQNGIVQIDNEVIFYNTLSSNVATNCIRGFNNTTAASHTSGANVSSAFFTVINSNNDTNNGDFIILSNCSVSSVGGIANTVINGEHQVFKYSTNLDYVLATGADNNLSNITFCTSSVSNVANVTVQNEYPVGLAVYSIGNGWGAGPWSRGGWGSAYNTGTGVGQQLRLWSNDNYGEDLVLAPRGGPIFYWQAANGVGNRAKYLSDLANAASFSGSFVPTSTNVVVASAIQRFVIAFGANSYDATNANTPFDPMLVRWSDQEEQYQWVPAVTNQAGEFRLTNGSYIMDARATRQEILIWTDSALYSMQYLGSPFVWGFNIMMDNITIMSPNCAITINNITYWMGLDKFYMYSGRVETLPCALRQYIFDDINKDQAWQVTCGSNEGYNEIWWFYVSQSSKGTAVDKYVIYNYADRVWYYGSMERTAWLDTGIRQNPMAAFQTGVDSVGNPVSRVLYHEVGTDDVSGLTALPIVSYVQSSDFDIGDGQQFSSVWRMLPDVNFNGSNVNNPSVTMTLLPRQNSGTAYNNATVTTTTSAQDYSQYPEYTIQQFTGQVYTRLRGRQMSMVVGSSDLGVAWQLGTPRIDIKPDGRRA